jgi:hypothetical protein
LNTMTSTSTGPDVNDKSLDTSSQREEAAKASNPALKTSGGTGDDDIDRYIESVEAASIARDEIDQRIEEMEKSSDIWKEGFEIMKKSIDAFEKAVVAREDAWKMIFFGRLSAKLSRIWLLRMFCRNEWHRGRSSTPGRRGI